MLLIPSSALFCTLNIAIRAQLEVPRIQNLTFLQQCVLEIEENYFGPTDIIIFLNLKEELKALQLNLQPRIIQSHSTNLISFRLQKADAYVLTILEKLSAGVFELLARSSHWNPRAKFVIVFDGNPANLFLILKKYYVFNVVVLLQKREDEIQILSYFPYDFSVPENERIDQVPLDVCLEGRLQNNGNLFPAKLPTKWTNTTVRLALMHYPPYVIIDSEGGQRSGIELEMLKLAQKILGFKVEYVNKSYSTWGSKYENGSYGDAYGDLQDHSADMALGLFTARFDKIWDFDLSFPFMEDSSKIVVPAAKLKPRWQNILEIFPRHLWVAVLISSIAISVLLYAMARKYSDLKRYQDLLNCFLVCARCLLAHCPERPPKREAIKIVYVAWVILGWIIAVVFQSYLTSALNFDSYQKQIYDVQELIDSKMEFGYHDSVAYVFSDMGDAQHNYIVKNHVDCPLMLACLNRTAFQGDFALMGVLLRYVQYTTNRNYLRPDGTSMVYFFKSNVATTLINACFSKGFPVYQDMRKVLFYLKTLGFVEYHYRRLKSIDEVAYRKQQVRKGTHVLGLYELRYIFILLVLGWLLALAAFVLEHILISVLKLLKYA